jgi:DNA-binding response OmpR family regulator
MQKNARILLVDADAFLRTLGERLLTDAGYTVTSLSDPAAVFPLPDATDLVVLAARDPAAPVLGCYARLRRENPGMPALVIGSDVIGRAIDPADHVSTPYEPGALLTQIADRLRSRQPSPQRLHDRLVERGHTSVDAEQLVTPEPERLTLDERIARLIRRRGERGDGT